jgi:hypothetical protein
MDDLAAVVSMEAPGDMQQTSKWGISRNTYKAQTRQMQQQQPTDRVDPLSVVIVAPIADHVVNLPAAIGACDWSPAYRLNHTN